MNQIAAIAGRPVKLRYAFAASAGLSVLFMVVYGWTNWFTSQRADVGTIYFEWERLIPFVPALILPYLSIDLFFVGAPFLCKSNHELATFAKRITAAIVVAGICFLVFPLRLAVDRPHATGWIGGLFNWFREMDKPHNLLPSLHIALRSILAVVYAKHTRGWLRGACNVWFSLIGLSTILTYQHHVIDIAGGFALAGYCFYFIPERREKLPVVQNRRIGGYYVAGALLCLLLILSLWPWGSLFFWPALACAIVASGYFGAGPGIYRKRNGRLPLSTWWALGPTLLGQRLSLLYYSRQCRPWDAIEPNLWIGRILSNREAEAAVKAGVSAVLDLSAEFTEAAPFRALKYCNIPILDLTAPTEEQLGEMVSFIEDEAEKGIVYIHCKIGYSRSAAAIAAYLIKTGKAANADEAMAWLRKVRPSIVIRPEVVSAIRSFGARESNVRHSPSVA